MHGKGVYTWPDGRIYSGNFQNDQRNGFGVYEWGDGRVYKGFFENGLQHGRGHFTDTDGSEYEEEWKNGKRIKQKLIKESKSQAILSTPRVRI